MYLSRDRPTAHQYRVLPPRPHSLHVFRNTMHHSLYLHIRNAHCSPTSACRDSPSPPPHSLHVFKCALQLLINRYGSIRFVHEHERVSTQSFVGLSKGNSMSNHLGAQGTFDYDAPLSFHDPNRALKSIVWRLQELSQIGMPRLSPPTPTLYMPLNVPCSY